MLKQTLLVLFLLIGGLGAIGCSSTQKVAFDISVKNNTEHPVTIWLTKDGPPVESKWRSPEQMAMGVPGHEERVHGLVVEPGKTAFTGPIEGHFEPGNYAWLRVYDGTYASFSDLLAVSRKSSSRVDYPLDPGKNRLVVKDLNGRIAVTPERPEGEAK